MSRRIGCTLALLAADQRPDPQRAPYLVPRHERRARDQKWRQSVRLWLAVDRGYGAVQRQHWPDGKLSQRERRESFQEIQ